MATITTLIAAWVLAVMTAIAPPGRPQFIREAQESREQAIERYTDIANTIATLAVEQPPIAGGKAFTTALMVSLTFHESAGFRRDVDLGVGRFRLAGTGWQDFGRSWCLGQFMLGLKTAPDGSPESHLRTPEGWSGPELVADRSKCLKATLNAARRSFSSCTSLPVQHRLSTYAAGSCTSKDGQDKSARRVRFANVLLGRQPFPKLPKNQPPSI